MALSKRLMIGTFSLAASTILFACADNEGAESGAVNDSETEETENEMESMDEENSSEQSDSTEEMDHSGMDMSGSGEIPEGLQEAEAPKFEAGDTAIITASHMEGMEGAEATIVGAYDTVAYSISYDPTDGGDRVEDHKWVIHEEISDRQEESYQKGDEVKVEASHMEGMEGAMAEIDTAEETTVYIVDFTLENGDEVTNHKWITEEELKEPE
ncbi:hypothetical protein JMA_02420 [Jeotgalibacillus malaysiensis]|uniref:DUF1541 domain-containing protein n=1 Tax=Jeotgalibacillus malaysiensis TaxID=1508404 RepID=A0A0B5ANI3_9BACL|nr:hypothetical protein JMA_02420 [Jeotgalibacillus malaysiensis]